MILEFEMNRFLSTIISFQNGALRFENFITYSKDCSVHECFDY